MIVVTISADAVVNDFDRALPVIVAAEGGDKYTDKPLDRGGPTRYGITQVTFDEWQRHVRMPRRSVRTITPEEVASIYRDHFWLRAKCDLLPWPLSLMHFDSAVNHGTTGANRILQRALKVPVDGKIGPVTVEAAQRISTAGFLWSYQWARLGYYARIVKADNSQATFFEGWVNRVQKLLEAAT